MSSYGERGTGQRLASRPPAPPHHPKALAHPQWRPERWQVERLALVGLLKYDEPVVYLSDYLPKMDELRDAPTRPLDAFEQAALSALRGGEDLMVQDGPDRMRMLGSLRPGGGWKIRPLRPMHRRCRPLWRSWKRPRRRMKVFTADGLN